MTAFTEAAPLRDVPPFRPRNRADRNAFAVFTGLVWIGVLLGFGSDIAHHVATKASPYPWIVHVHAAAFVSWLVLFTVQLALVRARRIGIHRKLGFAMLGLAAFMAFIGPATAIYVNHQRLALPDADPAFIAIQLTDILGFVGLVTAGALLRNDAAAHKRLLLMALLYIGDAGFARFMAPTIGPLFHNPFVSDLMAGYLGADLLILALGVYDLATRGRLHPAYLGGLAWATALQLSATWLHLWPAFKPFAVRLVGG